MAITLSTELATDVAAFAPCVVAGNTTRASAGFIPVAIIIMSASPLDKLRIRADTAAIEVGDSVVIAGAEGDRAQFNGGHEVTNKELVSGTTYHYDLNIDYVASVGSAYGTVARNNVNLLIRFDVYDDDTSELLGSVYTQPTPAGDFSKDVSRPMQSALSSNFTLTAGAASSANTAKTILVEIYEQWRKNDFTTAEVTDAANDQTTFAHRSADLGDYLADDLQLKNISYTAAVGSKLVVNVLDNLSTLPRIRFVPDVGSATIITATAGVTGKNYAAVYEVPAGAGTVTVQIFDNETSGVRASYVVKVVPNACGKRLYYLNRLGGYASIEFVDYIARSNTDRVDIYPTKAWLFETLTSVEENRETAEYFGDLVSSPEIYDQDGNPVELVTAEVTEYGEYLQIQVETRKERNFIR